MGSLTGRTLGVYEVGELLGAGGFAEVYRAHDARLHTDVALKVLHEFLAHDPAISERFINEARNMARLRGHQNVATIYFSDQQDERSYFVMELVEGGTLKDLLASGKPLELDRAITLHGQIADALGYAHMFGIIHRDVKPANVLMKRPDCILLSDFGIARALEHTFNTVGVLGTYYYMAPEQARAERVSPQTDQYALGIILYQMLTGTLPFRADSPSAPPLPLQHIEVAPPPPREHNPRIAEAMEQAIMRALAKEPEQRFPDMAAFAAATRDAARMGSLRIPKIDTAADEAVPTTAAPGASAAEVRKLLEQGEALERAGELDAARAAYQSALDLGLSVYRHGLDMGLTDELQRQLDIHIHRVGMKIQERVVGSGPPSLPDQGGKKEHTGNPNEGQALAVPSGLTANVRAGRPWRVAGLLVSLVLIVSIGLGVLLVMLH